jgi:hypothetical protein
MPWDWSKLKLGERYSTHIKGCGGVCVEVRKAVVFSKLAQKERATSNTALIFLIRFIRSFSGNCLNDSSQAVNSPETNNLCSVRICRPSLLLTVNSSQQTFLLRISLISPKYNHAWSLLPLCAWSQSLSFVRRQGSRRN